MAFPSPARLHRTIQLAFVLFLAWTAWELYGYAAWLDGKGAFVPRPPAAEAFLPLSALLGLKRFLLGHGFDPVHPAGLTVLLVALASALLCRRGFCGFLCPVGWLSGALSRFGERNGLRCEPGKRLEWLLTLPKYLILGLLLYGFMVRMGVREIDWFIMLPYNLAADVAMLRYFLEPGTATLMVLAAMGIGSIFLPGLWCRGFCPYGALLGLLSLFSPAAVNREAAQCTGCGRCRRACPSRIAVDRQKRVSGPECVGCGECVSVCPTGCLRMSVGYGPTARRMPGWFFGAATLAILFCGYGLAVLTGHWNADLLPLLTRHGLLPPFP